MSIAPLTAEQEDALTEVANIAMGRAGASLGVMLDTLVGLSVPHTEIVSAADAAAAVARSVGERDDVTAVRQSFFNGLQGEAIALYGPEGCRDLADLLGHDGEADEVSDEELLLDVSNILVGAVLNSLGDQLHREFAFSPPEIMAVGAAISRLLDVEQLRWAHALLVEVNFSVEERGFRCHLVLMLPERSIDVMRDALTQLLSEL
ncbi:MAG: hypothetical protein PVH31_08390 [Ectothiorhodospiraceae bacterium]|jgi:chemotaxis protein CheC